MSDERPLFKHPPWMVGVMLVLGAMSLFVGVTLDPFWLVMGAPAILTLFVYVGVRIALSLGLGVPPSEPAGGSREVEPPAGVREPPRGEPAAPAVERPAGAREVPPGEAGEGSAAGAGRARRP